MKIYRILFILVLSLNYSCSSQNTIQTLPTSKKSSKNNLWIDATTGHKVQKISTLQGNNRSFYFHNNPFIKSKDGLSDLMVFINRQKGNDQYYALDLKSGELQQITDTPGSKKGEVLSTATRKIYYMVKNRVYAAHIDSKVIEFVYKFNDSVIGSISTINADGTLLGGALITKEENNIYKNNPKKTSYFNKIYEAKLKRSLITINTDTKELNPFFSENAWLNHIQFSPTDPENLMYCHEGPWHKVDRIWNINLASLDNQIIHKRTLDWEIAGHEFFSPDGKMIWYDLQIPRGVTFYLAGKNLETGEMTKYELKQNEWSIHYNISPDQKTFAGDGGDPSQVARAKNGMWIYHFTPVGNQLKSTKLVNMQNHDYDLEPNVHFTPDGKQIIFRANFEGTSQIYAVDIEKY